MIALHAHSEPGTLVLTLDGEVGPWDVAPLAWTASEALASEDPGHAVVLDLALVSGPGLAAVETIVRLDLIARRRGHRTRIRHVPQALARALDRAGLGHAATATQPCACRTCTVAAPARVVPTQGRANA